MTANPNTRADNVPIKEEQRDLLKVKVYGNRSAMGEAAAYDVAERMKDLLGSQARVRIVFAAAPSQNEFLASLCNTNGVDWSHVTAFHMDEYIGLASEAPQRFSRYLRDHIFDIVHPGEVHYIDCTSSIDEECRRYATLLQTHPIDIVCLGVGENGHIAFNDPPVADFYDSKVIKPVELDFACRQQQVHDGCFAHVRDVPTHALTLTVPTLMSGHHLFCIVPGMTKRQAVLRTLDGPITPSCPAAILRTHPDCTLYLDTESYGVQ